MRVSNSLDPDPRCKSFAKAIEVATTNFSTKYLVMCKVYADVGGIK